VSKKNVRPRPKFDPLYSDDLPLEDLAARVKALGIWIHSPGYHGGQARAQALDELVFLRECLWWLRYQRWRKELDRASWQACLDWVKLDEDDTESELLETLARSVQRVRVTILGPWRPGDPATAQWRPETNEEYLRRLRAIRASFRGAIR
jgi:hypothetical protein